MPAVRRRAITLAGFVSLATVLWVWLGRLGAVDGLTVEGPTHAVAGESVQLSVHVARLPAGVVLCADLHWASDRNTPLGFLAAGEPKVGTNAAGVFDFTVPVPAKDNLRFVNAIIYLSPDGRWSNHTFVVTTDLIPVVSSRDDQSIVVVRWPLHHLAEAASSVIQPKSSLLRWITGLVWLSGAAWFGRRLRRERTSSEQAGVAPRWGWVFVVGIALAGIWELAGLEDMLGNWARSLARAEDVYYPRAVFQKASISAVAAAFVIGVIFGWRRRTSQLWLLCFGLYVAIAIVNLLSLHALDQYAVISWHGVTLVEAIKLLCAVTALLALYRSTGPTTRPAAR